MKVILREDVESLGRTGDVVEVAGGYGRNYLLPRGLAVKASTRNLKELEHQKRIMQARLEKQKKGAEELARRLSSVTCTISRKTGEEEKLYGSVTTRDIEAALKEQGVTVDRKRIVLEEPIKQLGEYKVEVKVHPEVRAEVTVHVVAE